MKSLFALIGALALTSCATPYQKMGITGGVSAVRMSSDTAQIMVLGNAYTSPDVVQRYALRKAAEETLADGFDVFRISGAEDRSTGGSISVGSASSGRYGIFGSSFTEPLIMPGQTLIIRMSKGPSPNPMPDHMYDAHDVLKYLGQATAPS